MHDEVGGIGEIVGGETFPLPWGKVERLTVGQAGASWQEEAECHGR